MPYEIDEIRLTANDAVDRNVYRSLHEMSILSVMHQHVPTIAHSIARSIAQQVDISTTELLDLRQPRHTTIVLELLLPIRLLRNPVGHSRIDEPRRHAVHSDVVLCPLHRKGVCHVADAGFARSVRSRGNSLVRSVGSHRGCEDNRAFDSELDEGACCYASAVE